MSLNKALINCERCFRLANDLIEKSAKNVDDDLKEKYGLFGEIPFSKEDLICKKDFRLDVCSKSNDIYAVRNFVLDTLYSLNEKVDPWKGISGIALQASNQCANCDYSAPDVQNYLHENGTF